MNIRDNSDAVTAILGLQWNSFEDAFVIPATPVSSDYPIFKRNVLKKVVTVFDPLGLVSPFIVQGKIMLQELWNRGFEWNDEVEDEIGNSIQNWFSQLPCLNNVKVPRCLREPQPGKCKEVVTFVYASQQAASYTPSEYAYGSITTRLMRAK